MKCLLTLIFVFMLSVSAFSSTINLKLENCVVYFSDSDQRNLEISFSEDLLSANIAYSDFMGGETCFQVNNPTVSNDFKYSCDDGFWEFTVPRNVQVLFEKKEQIEGVFYTEGSGHSFLCM